jgi:hypothetical protein
MISATGRISFDAAHRLPGSKQSLERPAVLVRCQYLAPQAIAIAAHLLALPERL